MSDQEQYESHGEVWLGDLLYSLAHTNIGDETTSVEWAVEMMGLDPRFAEAVLHMRREAAPRTTAAERDAQPHVPLRSSVPTYFDDMPDWPVPYEIVREHHASPKQGTMPDWYRDAGELEDIDETQLELRPEFRPLFAPGTTRALLSTALATPNGEGDIDLEVIIERITRQRPITTLPRMRLSTMRLGIQLLIDRGEGMLPFSADQELLYEAIHEVVGWDRVETLYFDDSPLHKMYEGDRYGKTLGYAPPTPGTPVVVLTDLGLAGRRSTRFGATETEWLKFAKLVRGAECPLLALTPYGPVRTPRRLRDAMYVLLWDRVTNVSRVRSTVGHGLELERKS